MSRYPVDSHVHFHDEARVAPTLDAAAANFRAAGSDGRGLLGMLLLTQIAGERVFESLCERPTAGEWLIEPAAEEAETLIARRDEDSVAIVCGRQLRVDDGLEVLGLGTLANFPDGLALADAVQAVQESGAMTVLPWAFGKWLGPRGRRIDAMLEPGQADRLFVGDNGGRLELSGVPSLLGTAERRGFRVLPGTDPFPVAADHRRVGSFGFLSESVLQESAPWRSLRAWLMGRSSSPERYGQGCGLLRFVVNQAGIRLRRRPVRHPDGMR
ncbi:MAG: hypothetical protein ACREVI_04380 [Steroidobacteraceae bacterium]